MIFNGLLICVLFLTLFGLSLWPVLLKNSKHFKTVLIAANVIFLLMLLFSGASLNNAEEARQEERDSFRTKTLTAVAKKLEGTEKQEYQKVPESEQDIQKIESLIDQFSAEVAK